jgi:hypothetical protein
LEFVDFVSAVEPVVIATDEFVPNPLQPQVAVSNSGKIFITFGAGENVYFCKSLDRGQTFTPPTTVGQVPKLALGMRRGPRIVAIDEVVVITAIGHESGNVSAWNSLDGGESWSKSTDVNDEARSAERDCTTLRLATTDCCSALGSICGLAERKFTARDRKMPARPGKRTIEFTLHHRVPFVNAAIHR